ncbi:hypothetical protein KUTeg_017991 [Tegillarca granosa]|uniref:Uncharacterized protein n=1 Tax=Tegillarca granosa TaxID=220873 RepID=A0ABQ9EMB0_TEGGR|nr:hypothetical protein KUTeg_017991 [Tegillarca granosa]
MKTKFWHSCRKILMKQNSFCDIYGINLTHLSKMSSDEYNLKLTKLFSQNPFPAQYNIAFKIHTSLRLEMLQQQSTPIITSAVEEAKSKKGTGLQESAAGRGKIRYLAGWCISRVKKSKMRKLSTYLYKRDQFYAHLTSELYESGTLAEKWHNLFEDFNKKDAIQNQIKALFCEVIQKYCMMSVAQLRKEYLRNLEVKKRATRKQIKIKSAKVKKDKFEMETIASDKTDRKAASNKRLQSELLKDSTFLEENFKKTELVKLCQMTRQPETTSCETSEQCTVGNSVDSNNPTVRRYPQRVLDAAAVFGSVELRLRLQTQANKESEDFLYLLENKQKRPQSQGLQCGGDKCINYANEKELSYHSKSEPEISPRSRLSESTSGNVVLNKLLAQNQLLINKLCEISSQGYNPRQQGEERDSDNVEEETVVVDSPLQPQKTLDVLDSLLSAGDNQDNRDEDLPDFVSGI